MNTLLTASAGLPELVRRQFECRGRCFLGPLHVSTVRPLLRRTCQRPSLLSPRPVRPVRSACRNRPRKCLLRFRRRFLRQSNSSDLQITPSIVGRGALHNLGCFADHPAANGARNRPRRRRQQTRMDARNALSNHLEQFPVVPLVPLPPRHPHSTPPPPIRTPV